MKPPINAVTRFAKVWLPALALAVAVLVPAAAQADPPQPGPLNLAGEINGAPFRIIVPATWNGKLLVLAHGYDDKADHPGEVDVRAAFPRQFLVARPALLAEGWAVAGDCVQGQRVGRQGRVGRRRCTDELLQRQHCHATAHLSLGLFDGWFGSAEACRAKRWCLRRLHRLLRPWCWGSAFCRFAARDDARVRRRVRRARLLGNAWVTCETTSTSTPRC